MSYLEELLPEFRKGAKIRRREWPESLCISLRNSCGLNIPYQDVEANDWEFVKGQAHEPDWDYIIKNKCLCWFWDNKGDEKQIGYLVGINDKRFYLEAPEDCFNSYTYCRPVSRDEVTFYEEKKDEI